jgi:type I restriction enzyme S subunit
VSEFPLVKLCEVAEISGGITKNSKRSTLPIQRPYLAVANVYANRLDLEKVSTIGVNESELERAELKDGDLIVVEGNGSLSQLGRVALWRGEIKGCLHQNHLIKVRPGEEVESKWILYWLMSPAGRRAIEAVGSSTSGLHTLSLSKVSSLPTPLAPKEDQSRAIAYIELHLSRLDETIATLQAIQAKLKQARASILKAAVEGRLVETEAELAQRQSSCFESGDQLLLRSLGEREVQHNGESSKEQRSRRYKTPSSPDPQSVDGLRLPPGWALSSIEQISSGLRYSLCIGPFGSNLKVSDYCEEGVPLIFVRNIRAENFSIEQATFVTHVKAAELAAHMARPGDILITKMGDPPGDSAIYPAGFPEAVITADVIKLHVASTYSLRFILYALRSPFLRRQILSQTKGVAQKKVSLERFAKIPIPIPPFAEQERIADEVERRFSVLDQVEATVNASFRRCGQLRQAVLKRAFAG